METNELRQLTERFLAGETSIEEERRLYALLDGNDLTAEQLAIRSIIPPPTATYDTEKWLTEDETAAYDSVIRSRRRRVLFVRRAAAAVLAGIVFMTGMIVGSRHAEDGDTSVAQSHIAQKADNGAQNDMSTLPYLSANALSGDIRNADTPAAYNKRGAKASRHTDRHNKNSALQKQAESGIVTEEQSPALTLAAMTPYDSLHHIIGNIERELQEVSDSVYIAHVGKLLETDSRLQRLVNKAMVKSMLGSNREFEATNRIY